MSRSSKPYRRYRARGREDATGDGLAELRSLTARATGGVEAPPAPPRPPEHVPPVPARGRPGGRPPRDRPHGERRWWSLRGLSAAGWAGRIALVLLVLLVGWAGLGYWALDRAVGEANARIAPAAHAALDPPPGGMLGTPTNTLILGIDKRRGATRSRADTILVMRTDPDAGRIKYLSIPRDWRVELPGQGTQKINASFYFYGQAGAIRAVKRLTGLPIHHLMVVNFRGFPDMVDALGGVTVTNPTALEDCPYEAGRTVSFPAGRVELDGRRALEFARVRKCDGDLNRALRQQAVVAAMKDEVLSPAELWRAPWRGADVVRSFGTDIGTMDMVKMGWLQARLDQRGDDRILLTGEPQMIGGVAYVVQTDPDRNEREIARFIGPS
jgi:polyisoprenyl-teichoic acid--peptidoglycan teichoic acid transferase